MNMRREKKLGIKKKEPSSSWAPKASKTQGFPSNIGWALPVSVRRICEIEI